MPRLTAARGPDTFDARVLALGAGTGRDGHHERKVGAMASRRAARWGRWTAGVLTLAALAPASPQAEPRPSATIKEAAQAKVRAATEILTMCREFLVAPPGERGTPPPIEVAEQIQQWSRALTEAKLEAAEDRAARLAILTEALDRAKGFEGEVKDLTANEASGLTKLTAAKALYYRVEAEGRLIREREAGEKPAR